MSNHIPMISSAVAGPLGVIHLPRLWQKASLEACGKLHPDYPGIGKGYDSMVLAACGLADDGSVNPGAVDLNNLDDWATFHKEVLS